MSSDTEEEVQAHSPLRELMRNVMYVFGVFILLWILLAKNMPNYFSPIAQSDKANRVPTLAKSAPETAPTRAVKETVKTAEKKAEDAFVAVKEQEPDRLNTVVVKEGLSAAEREHMADLEKQLATLTSELASVKKQLEESNGTAQKKDQLWNETLEGHKNLISGLKSQVDELKTSSTHQATALTVFSIMKEAAAKGEPFTNEYSQMVALIHDPAQNALLTRLQYFATTGIPTAAKLQKEFDTLLPQALLSSRKDSAFSKSLYSLIRIRKEGEQQQGQDDESVLARAEAKLQRAEIAGALKEMQALSPPAVDAFSPWARDAQNHIDGRNALDALQIAMLRHKPVEAKPVPPAETKTTVKTDDEAENTPPQEPVEQAEPQALNDAATGEEDLETVIEDIDALRADLDGNTSSTPKPEEMPPSDGSNNSDNE